MNFEGTYVAMVTPFDNKGNIDEEGLRSNINYLIDFSKLTNLRLISYNS